MTRRPQDKLLSKHKKKEVLNLEKKWKSPAEWFEFTRKNLIEHTERKLMEAKRKNNKEDIATYKHILDIYKAQLSKMREYRLEK